MNELEKFKVKIYANKYLLPLIIIFIIIVGLGAFFDALNKTKSFFSEPMKEATNIVNNNSENKEESKEATNIVNNNSENKEESIEHESFPNYDTINIENKIDIKDLIYGFLNNKNGNGEGWMVQSSNSAIEWVTEGIELSDNYYSGIYKNDCSYLRIGYCKITYDRQDLYQILRKRPETGKFKIILCGSRCCVNKVIIENMRITQEISPDFIENILSEIANVTKVYSYKQSNSMNDTLEYIIHFDDKKETKVNLISSCGSAGCTVEIILNI